jgi:hypothetical protein
MPLGGWSGCRASGWVGIALGYTVIRIPFYTFPDVGKQVNSEFGFVALLVDGKVRMKSRLRSRPRIPLANVGKCGEAF